MKIALKVLIALITVAIGCFAGMVLLNGWVWWKVLVFAGICAVTGQMVYKLLRVIDKRYCAK
ncbi:MAG: hypothetical protein RR576_11160 [Oscillospiraceae bacterium]